MPSVFGHLTLLQHSPQCGKPFRRFVHHCAVDVAVILGAEPPGVAVLSAPTALGPVELVEEVLGGRGVLEIDGVESRPVEVSHESASLGKMFVQAGGEEAGGEISFEELGPVPQHPPLLLRRHEPRIIELDGRLHPGFASYPTSL